MRDLLLGLIKKGSSMKVVGNEELEAEEKEEQVERLNNSCR